MQLWDIAEKHFARASTSLGVYRYVPDSWSACGKSDVRLGLSSGLLPRRIDIYRRIFGTKTEEAVSKASLHADLHEARGPFRYDCDCGKRRRDIRV